MRQPKSRILQPWWAVHRRLYEWVLTFARGPNALLALFLLSVAESCIIPIAPDVLLIALALEKPKRIWLYATVTTIASVLGGIIGYLIGYHLWGLVSPFFFEHVFSEKIFNEVEHIYQKWDFWAIFIAAFTPIPYKVFTLTAGVFQLSFIPFVIASIIGRGARFFLVALLIKLYGPPIKDFIERYFNWLTIAFVVILIVGFFIIKHFM